MRKILEEKNNKAQIGVIIIVIMGIFAGIALLQAIFTGQSVLTTKQVTINESIDIATANPTATIINENASANRFRISNYPDEQWKIDLCPISSFTLGNGSLIYTVDTDYVFTATTGYVYLNNSVNVNGTTGKLDNTTYAGYTWCPEGYNTDSGSRSIAGIIGLFAAIALVVFVAGKSISDLMNQ